MFKDIEWRVKPSLVQTDRKILFQKNNIVKLLIFYYKIESSGREKVNSF